MLLTVLLLAVVVTMAKESDPVVRMRLRCDVCSQVADELAALFSFYREMGPSVRESYDENELERAVSGICEEVHLGYEIETSSLTGQISLVKAKNPQANTNFEGTGFAPQGTWYHHFWGATCVELISAYEEVLVETVKERDVGVALMQEMMSCNDICSGAKIPKKRKKLPDKEL